MAKSEQHDMREYQIHTEPLTTSGAATLAWIPIGQSGQVVRVAACITTAVTSADASISFELGGTALKSNGSAAALVLPTSGSTIGDCETIDLDVGGTGAKDNEALEAEDGDALAAGSVLEIISDGGGDAGAARFVITIRP